VGKHGHEQQARKVRGSTVSDRHPRLISVWGLLAVVLMVARNLLVAFGVSIGADMVLVLPIILNEIFLGIWLMAKGFNAPAAASRPAGAAFDVMG
jgi:hypothetical protein